MTPSTQVDSFADAPPAGGPFQVLVGPVGPMVPDEGLAASEDGNGVKTIERAQIKTTRTMPEAVNTDNLKSEVLNFLDV